MPVLLTAETAPLWLGAGALGACCSAAHDLAITLPEGRCYDIRAGEALPAALCQADVGTTAGFVGPPEPAPHVAEADWEALNVAEAD